MKFIFALLLPLQVYALTFEVIGPCSDQPFYETSTTLKHTNLGHLTEFLLNKGSIPYTGDATGIGSINGSPVGDDALEVLSDSTMRAYGWCVEVDGVQPDVMPDKVMISENVKHIRWFYAFSLYVSGEWTQYCTPAHTVKSAQICK
ncbi:hypothetical protein CIK05_09555 [Bdellovibrio sp. qaytius]|nr:hypothetical protein CIK05_09555 [Bdellovibrio sp. qaytius]